MNLTEPRPPIPLGDEQNALFVAVPTAGDVIEMDARKEQPDVVLWYLHQFLVDASGRPYLRDQDDARRVPANIATAVVLKVQEALAARP
jgi:hypothetical protein